MNSTPTISVIVPVYNAEKTLRKCLESICASTYPHLEIVCVNDGSTDSSSGILHEFAARDKRIVVVTQENGGLSAARNAGLDVATGEYVAGVDADDYIDQDLFERAICMFTEETDIVSFGFVEEYDPPISRTGKKMYSDEPYAGYMEFSEPVVLGTHPMFWSKLWRRSVIEEHRVRFCPGVLHEDVDFFMKVAAHSRKICYLRHRGYHYLQHANSIMGRQLDGHATFDDIMDVVRRVYRDYKESGLLERHKLLFAHWLVRCASSARKYFPVSDHDRLQEAYYKMSAEMGLQDALPGDFPLKTLKPVKGWKKLFLTNLPNTQVYRCFGIAWGYRQYKGGKVNWRWNIPSPLVKVTGRTRRAGT